MSSFIDFDVCLFYSVVMVYDVVSRLLPFAQAVRRIVALVPRPVRMGGQYLLAVLLLWWVWTLVGGQDMLNTMKRLSFVDFSVAFVLFNLGFVVATIRLQLYYLARNIHVPLWLLIRLGYVAMLYNLLIPGGIGADGYRVWHLRRYCGVRLRSALGLQLLHRLSGLLGLGVCGLLLLLMLGMGSIAPHWWHVLWLAFVAAMMIGLIVYRVIVWRLWKESWRFSIRALSLALIGQGINLTAAWVLVQSLAPSVMLGVSHLGYLLLSTIAAVVGMIPISVGGLGLREATYAYGAPWLEQLTGVNLQPEIGVALSLALFAISCMSVLPGVVLLLRPLPSASEENINPSR